MSLKEKLKDSNSKNVGITGEQGSCGGGVSLFLFSSELIGVSFPHTLITVSIRASDSGIRGILYSLLGDKIVLPFQ